MKTIEINCQTGEVTERELTPEEIQQYEAMQVAQEPIPYEQRVVALIRERYSIDDEIAINRQRETKPEEWQEYFDYCEWCKAQAKT